MKTKHSQMEEKNNFLPIIWWTTFFPVSSIFPFFNVFVFFSNITIEFHTAFNLSFLSSRPVVFSYCGVRKNAALSYRDEQYIGVSVLIM